MIASFGDTGTEDLYNGVKSAKARKFPGDIVKPALRKLALVNAAAKLDDLRSPPGNRLEALAGDLAGKQSYPCKRTVAHRVSVDNAA